MHKNGTHVIYICTEMVITSFTYAQKWYPRHSHMHRNGNHVIYIWTVMAITSFTYAHKW